MKLFGNRRRAAHAKRTSLPRGVRTALIITAVILLLSGSVFAAWKLLVKPVERPAISAPGTRSLLPLSLRRRSPLSSM